MAQKGLEASKLLIDSNVDRETDSECSSCFGAFAVRLDKRVSTLDKHGVDLLVEAILQQCKLPETKSRGWAHVAVETLMLMGEIEPVKSQPR